MVSTTVEVQASRGHGDTDREPPTAWSPSAEIHDLPLVNRSVLDLTLTQPNTSATRGRSTAYCERHHLPRVRSEHKTAGDR